MTYAPSFRDESLAGRSFTPALRAAISQVVMSVGQDEQELYRALMVIRIELAEHSPRSQTQQLHERIVAEINRLLCQAGRLLELPRALRDFLTAPRAPRLFDAHSHLARPTALKSELIGFLGGREPDEDAYGLALRLFQVAQRDGNQSLAMHQITTALALLQEHGELVHSLRDLKVLNNALRCVRACFNSPSLQRQIWELIATRNDSPDADAALEEMLRYVKIGGTLARLEATDRYRDVFALWQTFQQATKGGSLPKPAPKHSEPYRKFQTQLSWLAPKRAPGRIHPLN